MGILSAKALRYFEGLNFNPDRLYAGLVQKTPLIVIEFVAFVEKRDEDEGFFFTDNHSAWIGKSLESVVTNYLIIQRCILIIFVSDEKLW